MKIKSCQFFLILCFFIYFFDTVGVCQEYSFQLLVSRYEHTMQIAAKCWKDKHYLRALDGFYAARELINDNMPQPSETFAWQGCLTLKMYSLILARFTESEYYLTTNQKEMVEDLIVQAFDWGLKLKQAITNWDLAKTTQSWEDALRMRWIHRFQSAIEQARKRMDE